MSWRSLVLATAGAVVLCAGGFAYGNAYGNLGKQPAYADEDAVAAFRESIRGRGATETVRVTSAELSELPHVELHDALHALGEALHAEIGLRGVAECAHLNNSGCVHGVLVAERRQGGEESAIAEACAGDSRNFSRHDCVHGYGHAIAYGTYPDILALEQALGLCVVFDERTMAQMCEYGAQMEWFAARQHESQSGQGDNAGPQATCRSLADRYQPGCFFTVSADGWNTKDLWGGPFSAIIERMNTDCSVVQDATNRRACTLGIGHMLSLAVSTDMPGLRMQCESMVGDPELRRACFESGVLWRFIHYGIGPGREFCSQSPDDAPSFCDDITELRKQLYF